MLTGCSNTFSALAYNGALVTLSGDEYGCIDNFAFFVTDQLFYVFDAEDAQWHSINYTPPGAAPWGGVVSGKEDYIYLNLWINNQHEPPPTQSNAYEAHQKSLQGHYQL